MRKLRATLMATLALSVGGCGYNTLHMQDRHVRVYWVDVLNQYQRRAELALQLVAAASERALQDNETQTQLSATRASANAPRGSLDLIDKPAAFAGFETAQAELSESLARLLLAYESESMGASDDDLRYLMEQLERAEQRIASARSRYSEAVRGYNASVRSFPSNLTARLIGYRARPDFATERPKHVPSKPKQVGSRIARTKPRAVCLASVRRFATLDRRSAASCAC